MNHDSGKFCKLDNEGISLIQNMAAESLEMERGASKLETGRQHLERNDYIVAKQKRELEDARKQAEELAREHEQKTLDCEKLDKKIHEKQVKDNRENGSAILSGLAHIAGKGRYAQLETENEKMKKQVAAIPQVVAQQVETLTITYKEEITKEQNRADFWLTECNKQERIYKGLITELKNREENLKQELQQRDKIIATMKAGLTEFLRGFTVICQNAINAVIGFTHDTKLQHFTFPQATAINEYLSKESRDRRNGATILTLLTRPFLSMFEHQRGKAEIENVVDNFDYYKERGKQQKVVKIQQRVRR